MNWWSQHPEAWAATRTDLQEPAAAMRRYISWLKSLPGKPVFVGYPAGFDFLFVYWYLIRFTGESPFSFSALDIKSYAMALLKTEYRESVKRNMPRRWFGSGVHRHIALDDAIEQGELFCNMLAENLATRPSSSDKSADCWALVNSLLASIPASLGATPPRTCFEATPRHSQPLLPAEG